MTVNNNDGPELPEGYKDIPEEDRKKARRFFDHAKSVAATGQFDYAIEMFVQGLNLDPEDVEQHKLLRDLALKRKVSGGKNIGMFEKNKYPTTTKDDKLNMLNAERLLAFDVGSTGHMITMAQSAHRGGFYDTALWVADMLKRANNESPRPDAQIYLILKEIYRGLHLFEEASEMCSYAMQLKPEDMDLRDEMKRLAAQSAIKKGKYGVAKSFRDSIKDMTAQIKLMEDEKDMKSEDILLRKVRDTKADWRTTPDDMSKFNKYIEALKATESFEQENIAIEELMKVFAATKQFKFRAMVGQIKISQMNRMERSLRADKDASPGNIQKKKEYDAFMVEKTQAELEEFRMVTQAYPTDMTAKFRMAERMFALRQFQDVIPILQQVRHDPKHRASASTLLGRAFLEAGFVDEAVDTLKSTLDDYPTRGDDRSKDITYWYGRTLEAKKEISLALKQYSLVAQMEFKYKDVQERIKRLRTEAAKRD